MGCSCSITSSSGNFYNVECYDGMGRKKYYTIQAASSVDALHKANIMCMNGEEGTKAPADKPDGGDADAT